MTAPTAHPTLGRPPGRDLLLLCLAVAAVSTSAPLIRQAAIPALAIAFWRNGLATAVLVPAVAVVPAQRRHLLTSTRRERRLAVAAGLLLAVHFAAWIPSLSYTTVASSVALVATQPVWAALLARARGYRVPATAWAGIAVALAGAVALTGVDVTVSARALFGDALALAGGMLAAAYVTVGSEVRRTVTTTVYTVLCYGTAALVLLVACLAAGKPLTGYPAGAWWCLLALTAGPQLLGHSVFNRVLRTTSPTVVSVAILGEIVGAALLAAWWFGERPQAATVPAAFLIMVGLVLVIRAGSSGRAPTGTGEPAAVPPPPVVAASALVPPPAPTPLPPTAPPPQGPASVAGAGTAMDDLPG